MVIGTPREPVDIPRERWAQTVERMRAASLIRFGVVLSALEPCEHCGVEVIDREDLATGARDVVEVLALQYKTADDGVRGIAGWTSPHRRRR